LKIPIPEIFREKLGKSITRVVLIANNPAITRRLVDDVVKDGDLLVLFNAPAPLDHVAHRPQPKLFFFRAKGATGNHWGLPPLVNRIGEIELLVGTGELALAYSRYPPHRANLPQGILALLDNSRTSMLVPEQHAAWKDYPVRPKIEFSGPSSGFMIYRLFAAIRRSAWYQLYRPRFDLVLLGFNHSPGGYYWEGHAWDFERKAIRNERPHALVIPAVAEPLGKGNGVG
jgi:hypothetical protein